MVDAHGEGPGLEVEIEVEEEPYDVDRVVSASTCGTERKLGICVEVGTLLGVEGSVRGGIAEDVEHGEKGGMRGGIGWRFVLSARDGREGSAEGSCR